MKLQFLAFVVLWFGTLAAQAAPVRGEHVEAELLAENASFKTGDFDNWIALRLRPDPGWHVYWANPGDSGIPSTLQWQLPAGVTVGEMQWPYPHRHSLGDLTNYGYSDETLHLIAVRVVEPGTVNLQAKAKWLVCKDICIPGEADLSLSLPATSAAPEPDLAWKSAFDKARAELPQSLPGLDARYAVTADDFSLAIRGMQFPQGGEVQFYPLPNDLVAHAAPQRVQLDPANGLVLSQKLSSYFVEAAPQLAGVLVVKDSNRTRAYRIDAEAGEVAVVPASRTPEVSAAPAPTASSPTLESRSLLTMLVFALIGGLILNLMPCVFPVLAMKALSVVKTSGESARAHRRHALAYTAGVILSFVAVAGLLIALRAGGAALGWGFQLQSPIVVFVLTAVIFAMGLSLSGVVHFGGSWMGLGQSLAAKPGEVGSFFTGVLAVIVASPCTAPFMAPALGFALAQDAISALLVFAVLGLGLALPFLLIGFVPRLARVLPRPGAWMETFKQAMAFPMYLTAVWLLWVLGGLTDRDGMALALVGLLLVALALWLMGRARGGAMQGLAMLALIAAGSLVLHPALHPRAPEDSVSPAGWETYSDLRFDQLRAEGRSVFVDFTADWCLTCKLNERGALRSEAVRDAFRRHDVALLVGDWTRADPAITAVLQRYGHSGVPLYLVSKQGAEPMVLPQVLTPDIVARAFQ
ncbi:MAG: protein-disulfide reductase DsbD family protein [Panacagrimonas sp.]